jgi:hypothetical protein
MISRENRSQLSNRLIFCVCNVRNEENAALIESSHGEERIYVKYCSHKDAEHGGKMEQKMLWIAYYSKNKRAMYATDCPVEE